MESSHSTQTTSDTSSETLPKRGPGRPKKSDPKVIESVTNQPGHVVFEPADNTVDIFPPEPTPEIQTKPKTQGVIVDTTKTHKMSHDHYAENLKLASEKQELETNVNYCVAAGIEWLEVSKELLTYFNKGKMPESVYYIYKNVKLVLEGTAEQIAQKEKMDCHQVLFKDEGYMKVR